MKKQTRIVPRVFVEEISHDIVHPLTGVCEGRWCITIVFGEKKYCYAPVVFSPVLGRLRVPVLGASRSVAEWFLQNYLLEANPMEEIMAFPEDCSADLNPERDPFFSDFSISKVSLLRFN